MFPAFDEILQPSEISIPLSKKLANILKISFMRESTAMFDKTMFKYFSDHHYNIHWSKVTIVLVYKILKS